MIVLLVTAAVLFHGNRKQSKMFIFVAFILLFAVMGLRNVDAFGSDAWGLHGSYVLFYHDAGTAEWSELLASWGKNYNMGFTCLMKAIYDLTNGDYQFFITTLSLFVVFSYMRFIKKYSPSPIQSVLCFLGLFYYTFLFDALKQASAMAVLLYAFDAIIEKKPIKFIILVAIASYLHFPALIFLPAYWIGRMKIGRNYLLLLALILIVTFVFRDRLLKLMLDAYGSEDAEVTMEGIRFLRNKALIMIVIVVFAIVIRPPAPEDNIYNALLMFAGISIVFQTFCGYNNIFERLADYYFHTAIVFIPLIFEKKTGSEVSAVPNLYEQLKNAAMLLICVFSIWRFLSYVNNSGVYLPYYFIWQQ